MKKRLNTPALLEERFWRHVQKGTDDECWLWEGAINATGGYGMFDAYELNENVAHRTAWILTNGPLSKEQELRHSCDNPPCCNPAHLTPGTHMENMDDMMAKGRGRDRFGKPLPNVRRLRGVSRSSDLV